MVVAFETGSKSPTTSASRGEKTTFCVDSENAPPPKKKLKYRSAAAAAVNAAGSACVSCACVSGSNVRTFAAALGTNTTRPSGTAHAPANFSVVESIDASTLFLK